MAELSCVMQMAKSLTMKEIIIEAGSGTFSWDVQRRQADLLSAVDKSPQLQKAVEDAYWCKQNARTEEQHAQIKCAHFSSSECSSDSVFDSFLRNVDMTVKEHCLSNFVDCTGNMQASQVICIVCAGKYMSSETLFVDITALPNCQLLVPSSECCHPAQDIIHSMLLYTPSIVTKDEESKGHVCLSCMHDLCGNHLPAHALANRLWLDAVPPELSILSPPERLLITLYYSAAFVIKLYPQKKGARQWDTSGLNSGLHGNVSMYRLNTKDITTMIKGDLLPRHPDVLAATIAISIIGPQNLPACCKDTI
ncbi:hypothetical protein BDR07DRAFT_1486471 [Suillus spraguei]|nr:hypothetical protein BDR07DRAFT_1486471 [Suillus spraguei]